ncbi:MAG: hypothetical protein ABJP87_16755 [Bauldia litoralis]
MRDLAQKSFADRLGAPPVGDIDDRRKNPDHLAGGIAVWLEKDIVEALSFRMIKRQFGFAGYSVPDHLRLRRRQGRRRRGWKQVRVAAACRFVDRPFRRRILEPDIPQVGILVRKADRRSTQDRQRLFHAIIETLSFVRHISAFGPPPEYRGNSLAGTIVPT